MPNLLSKIFGSHNDRVLKAMLPLVERTNSLEREASACSDAALAARTASFRERL